MLSLRRPILTAVCIFGLFSCSSLQADQLTLTSSSPPGNPLVMDIDAVSPPLLIQLTNDVAIDEPENLLSGWQTRLAIVPAIGAEGELRFNDPPAPIAAPPNYVFEPFTNLGIRVTNSGDELLAFDLSFALPLSGAQVPLAPDAVNLLQLDFTSSPNASGLFEIFALDGPANSEWTDSSPEIQNGRAFANVPNGAGPVQIGAVLVGQKVGDFDQDGLVNASDISILCAGMGTSDPLLDLTEDGIVSQADLDDLVINVLGTQFGDADLNGKVGFPDFMRLAFNYDRPGDWSNGDFDCSSKVDFIDFLILSTNYGFGNSNSNVEAMSVPEPSGSPLLIVAALSCLSLRSKRVKRLKRQRS